MCVSTTTTDRLGPAPRPFHSLPTTSRVCITRQVRRCRGPLIQTLPPTPCPAVAPESCPKSTSCRHRSYSCRRSTGTDVCDRLFTSRRRGLCLHVRLLRSTQLMATPTTFRGSQRSLTSVQESSALQSAGTKNPARRPSTCTQKSALLVS